MNESKEPTAAQKDSALAELMPRLREMTIYDITSIANRNRFMFFFTLERPDTHWYTMHVEDKFLVVPDDNDEIRLFLAYSSFFGFRFANGKMEMMVCKHITDEDRDRLRKSPDIGWEDGRLILAVKIPDTEWNSLMAVPFSSFNMVKPDDYSDEHAQSLKARWTEEAQSLIGEGKVAEAQEVMGLLQSDFL